MLVLIWKTYVWFQRRQVLKCRIWFEVSDLTWNWYISTSWGTFSHLEHSEIHDREWGIGSYHICHEYGLVSRPFLIVGHFRSGLYRPDLTSLGWCSLIHMMSILPVNRKWCRCLRSQVFPLEGLGFQGGTSPSHSIAGSNLCNPEGVGKTARFMTMVSEISYTGFQN